jgi:hypothetical protein
MNNATLRALLRGDPPQETARAIAMYRRSRGVGRRELVLAERAGKIEATCLYDRRAPFRTPELLAGHLPHLLVVNDDRMDPAGPRGWCDAEAIRAWSVVAIVHTCTTTPQHYQAAICAARLHGRAVLVEAASAHATAWADLFAGKPTWVIASSHRERQGAAKWQGAFL